MKEQTMEKSKRKSVQKRNKASYKNLRMHSDKLSSYRDGSPLSSPMAQASTGDRESPADREYRRMRDGDVYRGSSKKSPHSNMSKRRYK